MAGNDSWLRRILYPQLTSQEVARLRQQIDLGPATDWPSGETPQYKDYGAPWSAADLGAAPQSSGDPALPARVAQLETQLLSMALYCRTLLQLMVDKNVITVDEFKARMDELDLADGVRDNK